MSSLGEHRTVIFTIGFLAVFILLISSLPSTLLQNQTYTHTIYKTIQTPDEWDTGAIGKGDVKSEDYGNVSFSFLTWTYFRLTEITTNDTIIDVKWNNPSAPENFYVTHRHPIFWIFYQNIPVLPNPLKFSYINNTMDNNVSSFFMRCQDGDIQELYTQVSYDNSSYDSFEDAWGAGHVRFYFAFLRNSTQREAHYDVWTLLGQLMLFQSPQIHPVLNALIAIPIWTSIVISIIYILDKILPF